MIDYVCMDRRLLRTIGQFYARLKLDRIRVRRRGAAKKPKSMVGWRPADINEYTVQLHHQLVDILRTVDLASETEEIQHGLSALEDTVRKTAETCKIACQTTAKDVLATGTRDLITRRRGMQSSAGGEERADRSSLNKLIQRNIRKDIRDHKRELVAEKAAAFRDLRSISG